MKRIYLRPKARTITCNPLLASLSGNLDGTANGGNSGNNGIKDADSKRGIWDYEM